MKIETFDHGNNTRMVSITLAEYDRLLKAEKALLSKPNIVSILDHHGFSYASVYTDEDALNLIKEALNFEIKSHLEHYQERYPIEKTQVSFWERFVRIIKI